MREALVRLLPMEANLYSLASVNHTDAPGTRLARFERAAPSSGAVTRTRVAFCVSAQESWKCEGPWPGARVALKGASYSALAPVDVDDATLVALFGYVGSECFATQARRADLAPDASAIRSVARETERYEVQMSSPKGLHLLSLEPANGDCAFELRAVSALTKLEP